MIQIDKELLSQYPNLTVAVSGGVDSIVVAHLLWRVGYNINICHFNHNLRQQNVEMQKAVERFCIDFELKLETETRVRADIKGSVEDGLRKERLDFFRSLNSYIVLAHHLDDAVEGYVMNMLRGCPEYVPIPRSTKLDSDKNLSILLRPFLTNSKQAFIDYANNNDLWKYVVVDETNTDNSYRRNWIRNEILPQFKDFGLPKIVKKKFYIKN